MTAAGGTLVVISGPSGSGKTSIIEMLRAHPRVRVSVSAATRPPRKHEKDGRDYHFVSREQFLEMLGRGEFIETNDVFGNGQLYGSLWSEMRAALAAPGTVFIMELDVVGAARALEAAQREKLCARAHSVFIEPPSMAVLEKRLRARGTDDEAAIARRLKRADEEMTQARRNGSRLIVNHNLDQAVDEIQRLIGLEERRLWTTPK